MKGKKQKISSKHKMSEAVSVVSHQLKTPLSAIKGYLEVLHLGELGSLNKKQKEYVDDALSNTNIMISLVKDLLDVSRIEENRMELKLKKEDIVKLTQNSIKELISFAKAKNCIVELQVKNKIPLLLIDEVKIKQVINNLITNAIKYNKRKGRVIVDIEKKKDRVYFKCNDEGIGITKKDQKKLFNRFFRGEKAIALATEGSGLGLYIARSIVKMHSGDLSCKSKENQGSTFEFYIPIKKVS